MKFKAGLLILLIIIIILPGCSSTKDTITNTIQITKTDEKVILAYLDAKTNDIASPRKGKMYSAFKLLGANDEKIYLWVTKIEYLKEGDKVTHEDGDAVSLPMVLNIKKDDNGFSIVNHKYPKEGKDYGESLKKLFPKDIKYPEDDERLKLEQSTRNRAEEDIKDNRW